MRELNSHSHEACAAQVENALVKTKTKRRAEESLESPTVVVNDCLTDISQSSLDADKRIHETVLRFKNMDPVEYLRSLAHNYQMN